MSEGAPPLSRFVRQGGDFDVRSSVSSVSSVVEILNSQVSSWLISFYQSPLPRSS
jgi:hypothetical protein